MAKILIIDDDPNGREMLRFRLEKAGHEIREAPDGDEGILLAQRLPDLIFLDVRIPKLDGWEVCRRLKSDPKTRNIPIVMLTGCSQPVQETYGKQCGADEYITKPWESAKLLDVTRKLLFSAKIGGQADVDTLMKRTKEFALRIIRLVEQLPRSRTGDVIGQELVRCGTAVGAVYRDAASTRSPEQFVFKIKAVEKEANQSVYWLGLLLDGHVYETLEIEALVAEGRDLAAIFAASAQSAKEAA